MEVQNLHLCRIAQVNDGEFYLFGKWRVELEFRHSPALNYQELL